MDPTMNRAVETASGPRILVARMFHESHGFSPLVTPRDDFVILRGETLLSEARTSGTTFGGIVRRLEAEKARLIPAVSIEGPPSGSVAHAFYDAIKQEIIEAALAARPDAIALELHGAMGTTELADAEGDLLRDLRRAVGPDVVIGIGLDLHAHLTEAMLDACDICIACKENPHSDVVACGEKVAQGVLAMLRGAFSPVSTLTKVRMVIPGANETAVGPLHELHTLARTLAKETEGIWDVSLYNVFRALDDAEMGQAIVVVSDGSNAAAAGIATRIGQGFWDRRERFVDDLWSIENALAHVAARQGQERFVLADMGDRVLAAAPGDSTAILSATMAHPGLRAAIPVTDPAVVEAAQRIGIGQEASFDLGGALTPGFAPLRVKARVVGLGDGSFRMRGPYRGGELTALGAVAVLRIENRISVLVTSKPGFTHDPAAFESNGVPIAEHDFVVVKSGYHFALNFAGLATPLLLRTPGIGYYTKGLFTWRKGRFWPEHDVDEAPFIGPKVSRRSGLASALS